MTEQTLNKAKALTSEMNDLKYFLSGNGILKIGLSKRKKMKLYKDFGSGEHQLYINDSEMKNRIIDMLKARLSEIEAKLESLH